MLNASALYLPTFAVLLGILLNWVNSNAVRKQIDDLKDSNHKDALEIMRQMTALHERVAVVETKQTMESK